METSFCRRNSTKTKISYIGGCSQSIHVFIWWPWWNSTFEWLFIFWFWWDFSNLSLWSQSAKLTHSCILAFLHYYYYFCNNQETQVWSIVRCEGGIPSPRDSHIAVTYGKCMFVFGGSTGHPTNDMYQYDFGRIQGFFILFEPFLTGSRLIFSFCIKFEYYCVNQRIE